MGCGCRKNTPSRPAYRPNAAPRMQTNITIQSQGRPVNPTPAPVSPGMDEERLRAEKLRREAIRRALNK